MATEQKKDTGLIIVSNRLPLSIQKEEDGTYKSTLSSGGLVTALSGLRNSKNLRWFGWAGIDVREPEEREQISKSLADNSSVGIFLSAELAHEHYDKFSSTVYPSSLFPSLSSSPLEIFVYRVLTTHRLNPLAHPALPVKCSLRRRQLELLPARKHHLCRHCRRRGKGR